MLAGAFAFVDLETTGCNPVHDRITEVAVVSVRDGAVTERWSRLVDPGVSIPEAIQALTGISNSMVAGQPSFEELASEVNRRLEGVTFVAHNARFDHGFLRNALARCGYTLRGPVLCTVKLSRRLYPQERGHGLDALIARHGLVCSARHRALGDADATWAFVAQAAASLPSAEIARHIAELTRRPSLPARLGEGIVESIPDTPGVYLFYDERDAPLYVGKSVHLRTRVLSHFAADHSSAKEMQLAQQTARIEWQRTAGELGALLKEAQLVKDLAPIYNRQLRRHAELVSIRWSGEPEAGPELIDGARVLPLEIAGEEEAAGTCRRARPVPAPAGAGEGQGRLLPLPGAQVLRRMRWPRAAAEAPGASRDGAGAPQARKLAVAGPDRDPGARPGQRARGVAHRRQLVLSRHGTKRGGAPAGRSVCTARRLRHGHLQAPCEALAAQPLRAHRAAREGCRHPAAERARLVAPQCPCMIAARMLVG
jgi:DNA polymerase III epsilon subunit family exonuclease